MNNLYLPEQDIIGFKKPKLSGLIELENTLNLYNTYLNILILENNIKKEINTIQDIKDIVEYKRNNLNYLLIPNVNHETKEIQIFLTPIVESA